MRCIPVWNRCNNRCVMCSNPPDYAEFGKYDLESLKARVARIRPDETHLYLTGGEPTLNPDILPLLSYIRARLPRTRILMDTNGRMFSYKAFAAKCAAAGNIEFQISICGHNAAAHDGVTRTPGSFAQAVSGMHNMLELVPAGVAVEIRFVLTRLSIANMEKVYKFAETELKGIKSLVFIFMEMEGHAGVNLKATGLTYTAARPSLEKFFAALAARKGAAARPGFELKLYHFPLCALPAPLWPYAWRTLPAKELAFPKACAGCAVKKYCMGVHKDYLKHIGAAEFKPLGAAPEMKFSDNPCRPITAVKA